MGTNAVDGLGGFLQVRVSVVCGTRAKPNYGESFEYLFFDSSFLVHGFLVLHFLLSLFFLSQIHLTILVRHKAHSCTRLRLSRHGTVSSPLSEVMSRQVG